MVGVVRLVFDLVTDWCGAQEANEGGGLTPLIENSSEVERSGWRRGRSRR